ncbi:MAG: hypothetical protein OEZ08_11020, partial [Betaproteobacteria bacterium]|nr:hypothetical protein [Betaproteobacteria bacterium]
ERLTGSGDEYHGQRESASHDGPWRVPSGRLASGTNEVPQTAIGFWRGGPPQHSRDRSVIAGFERAPQLRHALLARARNAHGGRAARW